MLGEGENGRSRDAGPTRSPFRSLFPLAAACGLGVAQPLYDLLARHPTLLVAHQLTRLDALHLAALLSLGMPLLVWLVVVGAGRTNATGGRYLEGLAIGLALALVPLQAMRHWPDTTAARLSLLGVLAIALACAYLRCAPLRRLLGLLAVGALVFPALFVMNPAIAGLGRDARPPGSPLDVGRPAPIVLLVLDELPMSSLLAADGALHAERFPNFERLRRASYWFTNATSVAHNTAHAVPAILTGRFPEGGPKTPDLRSYPETLLTLLAGSYNLNVIESVTDLCGDACDDSMGVLTLGERWSPALSDLSAVFASLVLAGAGPAVDTAWSGFWGESTPQPSLGEPRREHWKWRDPPRRYQRFEGQLKTFPRRTLHFLHLMLPHRPWQFLPNGKAYLRRNNSPHGLRKGRLWIGTDWEIAQAQQRHLLQVQYVDTLLGRLLDTLERLDRFDETLLIITSDHGCTFKSGDRRRAVTATNLIDLAHVPLLVKLPGQVSGVTDDRNAQTIDIVPTLADILDFDLPWPVDGSSLMSETRPAAEKRIYRSLKAVGAGVPWVFETGRLSESLSTAADIARRFPHSSLFVAAPEEEERVLIGRAIASTRGEAAAARAEVQRLADYDDVDLDDWWLPSQVMGTLELERPTDSALRVAIALDGTVQAITETYGPTPATSLQFTALLDPGLFANDTQHVLEFFLIDREGAQCVLRPIPVSPKN